MLTLIGKSDLFSSLPVYFRLIYTEFIVNHNKYKCKIFGTQNANHVCGLL